jgi:predicted phosphodiesterase
MRVAIFSDIHGNSIALDAVLGDIRRQGGVDQYWVLGDLVAIGFDPLGVLQRLTRLHDAHFVMGNTDAYVVRGVRPGPSIADAQENPDLVSDLLEIDRNFTWTLGAVAAAGWFGWLSELPIEARFNLPDGTRALCVHASPGREDGTGFRPPMGVSEMEELVPEASADLIFVGHTHVDLDTHARGARVLNPNSVSNPFAPDLRAGYLLLQADRSGYQLERKHVEYDREAVVAAVERAHHPAADLIIGHMHGERQPAWER